MFGIWTNGGWWRISRLWFVRFHCLQWLLDVLTCCDGNLLFLSSETECGRRQTTVLFLLWCWLFCCSLFKSLFCVRREIIIIVILLIRFENHREITLGVRLLRLVIECLKIYLKKNIFYVPWSFLVCMLTKICLLDAY